MRRAWNAVVAGLVALTFAGPALAATPCAPPAARDPMPEGAGHDHTDPKQHGFTCGLRQLDYLSLENIVPEPMLFGEIDAAAGIAVMATVFPEAGFVVFDLTKPRAPTAIARFRGPRCEVDTDTDCGADVKLTPDGKTAFLAIQRAAPPADPVPEHASRSKPTCAQRTAADVCPGIITVDLSNPKAPRKTSFMEIEPGGPHMVAYHAIDGKGYVFARARGLGSNGRGQGALIAQVIGSGSSVRLKKVGEALTPGSHDVFLYDDPVDKTTYLYVPGGFSGGLFIFDVGDPAHPRQVGSWTPKVEVPKNLWYVHNAFTFRHGGKRYTFVGPELFNAFPGIGAGHGSVAGPLWLLDTTDQAHPAVVGEWRNPGKHAAGNLSLSPHNSTFVAPALTWTAHYHGGVWLLDWSAVLSGTAKRPDEVGFFVPNAAHRTLPTPQTKNLFISAPDFLLRPMIWDVVPYAGVAYASDITGGLYVIARNEAAAAQQPKGQTWVRFAVAGALLGVWWLLIARRFRRRNSSPQG